MLPVAGKQLLPLVGGGSPTPGAAEPGTQDAGKAFGDVYKDEAPRAAPAPESSSGPDGERGGGKNLQSDGENLPPAGQATAEAEADTPAQTDTAAGAASGRDQAAQGDTASAEELLASNTASPVPTPYQPAEQDKRPAESAPDTASELQPVHPALGANLAEQLAEVHAVDDTEGGLPGAVASPVVAPPAAAVPRRMLQTGKASDTTPGLRLTEPGLPSPPQVLQQAVSQPAVEGRPLATQDLRSLPAVGMPNLADVVAPANDGNGRSFADRMFPDALVPRIADAPQPTASTTASLLGQPLSGVMAEGAGELQLAQRAEGSALLRPGDRAWNSEFAGRLTVMVKNGVQEASLQLHPADLGRLEIQIATDGDQTRVHFLVQNAMAREAIEQAMPRLREMLEQSGLQLAQSDVADQSQSQGRERTFAGDDGRDVSRLEDSLSTEDVVGPLRSAQPRGMIDHYV